MTTMVNAEVTLSKGGVPFDFGQSDGNGIVSFDNVPADGGYAVQVISRARARAGSSGTLTVTQSAVTAVDVRLSVLGVVSGTLVDAEGSPERLVAGGHITLVSGNVTLRTSTDAAGAYRFDGVPEGHFILTGFHFDRDGARPFRRVAPHVERCAEDETPPKARRHALRLELRMGVGCDVLKEILSGGAELGKSVTLIVWEG